MSKKTFVAKKSKVKITAEITPVVFFILLVGFLSYAYVGSVLGQVVTSQQVLGAEIQNTN